MGKLRWYKRDPDAALGGMMALTLEERGAYNTVLDLIYSRADELPDDDRFIAGWCNCDVRVWRRIKARLIGLGKLRVENGMLRNFRATSGVTEAISRVASAAEAANIRHGKSPAVSKENKDLGCAGASKTHVHRAGARQPQPEKKINTPSPEPAREADEADDWPAEDQDGGAVLARPPSNHRNGGARTPGDVLARFMHQTGPPEKRLKRQDRADQDMVRHLTTRGGMDTAKAWAMVMAARDDDDPAHTEAARELEKISAKHKLGFFVEDAA